jgi:hypothetical protein
MHTLYNHAYSFKIVYLKINFVKSSIISHLELSNSKNCKSILKTLKNLIKEAIKLYLFQMPHEKIPPYFPASIISLIFKQLLIYSFSYPIFKIISFNLKIYIKFSFRILIFDFRMIKIFFFFLEKIFNY